jgi:hypothetical protein
MMKKPLAAFQYGIVRNVGGGTLPMRGGVNLTCSFGVDYPPQPHDEQGSAVRHDLEEVHVELVTLDVYAQYFKGCAGARWSSTISDGRCLPGCLIPPKPPPQTADLVNPQQV